MKFEFAGASNKGKNKDAKTADCATDKLECNKEICANGWGEIDSSSSVLRSSKTPCGKKMKIGFAEIKM